MKTLFSIILFQAVHLLADDPGYVEVMTRSIDSIYQAQTMEELQASINAMQRIGNAEKSKWEPHYYVAFGYILMANLEQEGNKKDAFLDLAGASLGQSTKLNENESEIVALDGFIQMIRVTVDPAARGAQYSGKAFQAYQKALALNPENPRALGLMAQMQYGMAQFFKAPTDEACAMARKALEKFDTYKSDNPVGPQWGRGMTEGLLKNCK